MKDSYINDHKSCTQTCACILQMFEMLYVLLCLNCCWENPFGFRSVQKHSVEKRVLHLDILTLWVVFSSRGTLGVTLLK